MPPVQYIATRLFCAFHAGNCDSTHVGKSRKLHLRIDRAFETAEAKFEVIAVVDEHHVVVLHQLAPLLWVELKPRVAHRFHAVCSQRQHLGFAVHLHALKRRGGAGAVLEGHAAEQAVQALVGCQCQLKRGQCGGHCGHHAVDAFGSHQDAAQHIVAQFAKQLGHRVHIGQAHEFVEGAVD